MASIEFFAKGGAESIRPKGAASLSRTAAMALAACSGVAAPVRLPGFVAI
jgi:hypothetical protein